MAKTTRWDGGHASSNNWSQADNWDNGVPVAGDTIEFGGTTRLSPNNDLAADTSFAAITFVAGAGAFTIGGNRITLAGTVTNNDADTQIFTLDMICAAQRTFNCASGNIEVSSIISGAGSVKKSGNYSLKLTGLNTYTGITTIVAGDLMFDTIQNVSGGASALGAPTSSANGTITFQSFGGNLKYIGTGHTTDRIIFIGNGTCTVEQAGTGLLKFTSAPTRADGSPILALTGSSSGTGEFSGVLANPSTGTLAVTKSGTGTWELSGTSSSYTGTTTINQGTLSIASIKSVSGGNSSIGNPGSTANGTIAMGSAGVATLKYTGSGETSNRVINLNSASNGITLEQAGSGNLKFTSNFTYTNGAKVITLQGSTAGTGEISGVIANTGSGTIGITKEGSGQWTLSATNTYDGTNTINGGKLKAGVYSDSFGSLAPVVIADVAGAILDITGYDTYLSWISGGGATGGQIILGANDLHTGSNAAVSKTFAGIISGTGGFYKGGTYELALTGLNTYTGVTTVVQGTLRFNTIKNVGGGASSLGAPTTAANGTIKFQDFTSTLVYIGTGDTTDRVMYCDTTVANLQFTIEQAGTGVFKITSPFDANGTGSKEVVLQGSSAGTGELSGIVADIPGGTLSVRKKGTGTWTLSGPDTYTGATTIETGGTLFVSGTLNIASAVSVTGTLAGTGTINGPITVNNTGTFHPGPIGAAVGVMTTKGVTFSSTSIAMFDLDGSATPAADRITSVSGTVALGAAANTLTVNSIVNPVDSKVYTIISATTLTGTFNGKAEGFTFVVSGRTLQISYLSNTVTLTDITSGGGCGLIGDSVLVGDNILIGTESTPLFN